ncbi:MAG: LysE family transporter [Hominisplanchenecus sp.]
MTMSLCGQLLTYACVTGFSPGPNNILLLASTSKYGIKKCLRMLFGIWIGFLCICMICSIFCTALVSLVPAIRPYMKYVGAAYLVYLAWQTFRRSPAGEGEEKIPSFLTGFMLQFLNIKVIILVMTAYSGFILPGNTGFTALLLGAFPLLAGIGGGNLIWSALGGLLRQYYNKYYRFINTVMALLLLWCAWRVLT